MRITYFHRVRLGTAIQTVIHAAVDAAPIPARVKKRIKNCPGCGRRVRALDRITRGS